MRKLMILALAVTTATLSACGGKDSTGPDSIAGTYTLTTVNNAQLPFTTSQDATYKAEILASSITLRDDKTFTWSLTGRSTDNGIVDQGTDSFSGTYTITGSTLTLKDPEGSTTATLGDGVITMVIDGPAGRFTLVFVR